MVGVWMKPEDNLLRQRVAQFGAESWTRIAEGIPNRSAKQCRDRWRNHLDPRIIKTAFTTDEEITLENSYEELGNRWTEIAKRLPGRSEHDVKLRWKVMNPGRKACAKVPAPNTNSTSSTASTSSYTSSTGSNSAYSKQQQSIPAHSMNPTNMARAPPVQPIPYSNQAQVAPTGEPIKRQSLKKSMSLETLNELGIEGDFHLNDSFLKNMKNENDEMYRLNDSFLSGMKLEDIDPNIMNGTKGSQYINNSTSSNNQHDNNLHTSAQQEEGDDSDFVDSIFDSFGPNSGDIVSKLNQTTPELEEEELLATYSDVLNVFKNTNDLNDRSQVIHPGQVSNVSPSSAFYIENDEFADW